jgi:GT2 family glycosyltransferase
MGEGTDVPDVSVVIVNWNTGDVLLDCLWSLDACRPSCSLEAIVVDNGSTDDSVERVREELPWVRIIANRTNRGLAAANNQGLVMSRAPYALISNPDVLFRPGAIDALVDLLRRRTRAAFAVAKLVHPDGRVQPSAGDLPTLVEALVGRRFGRRSRHRDPRGFWWRNWSYDEERPIGHGGEACYLVRRQALAEIGPQDEGFPLDWEGIEWAARASEAGWQVWFCPAAVVTHIGGVSLRQARFRWIVSSHRGMYRYFSPRVSPWTRPALGSAITLRAFLKLAAMTVGGLRYERAHLGST